MMFSSRIVSDISSLFLKDWCLFMKKQGHMCILLISLGIFFLFSAAVDTSAPKSMQSSVKCKLSCILDCCVLQYQPSAVFVLWSMCRVK